MAETERKRPPVVPEGLGLGLREAEATRWGMVALMVLNVPIVSMSITVLKALELRPEMGAMKLPAAPALGGWGLATGS